jgi:FkbM family methyltransferase
VLTTLRRFIRSQILKRWNLWHAVNYGRVSYAQEGEDVLLWRILDGCHDSPGTYVEVGSNDPWTYSNTAFFYERGWTGVAIDPNPDFAPLFAKSRPKDVFLNLGISDREDRLLYHRFAQSPYNTFSREKAGELVDRGIMPAPVTVEVRVTTLGDALSQVWPNGRRIDLLSIDAEGLDAQIVAGHDFERFPVRFLFVELDHVILDAGREDPIVPLVRSHGFLMVSKLFKSGLFVHRESAGRVGIETDSHGESSIG